MPLMFAVSIGATVALLATTMFGLAWYEQIPGDGESTFKSHLIMGENTGLKVQHMVQNIAVGRIAPIQMIARKA